MKKYNKSIKKTLYILLTCVILPILVKVIITVYENGKEHIKPTKPLKEIQELFTIQNADALFDKLCELNERGLIAFGKKEDFSQPDKMWVFIIENKIVSGIYFYIKDLYIDIHSNNKYQEDDINIKEKESYWMIESPKLIKKE